jgi:hypothetical protein
MLLQNTVEPHSMIRKPLKFVSFVFYLQKTSKTRKKTIFQNIFGLKNNVASKSRIFVYSSLYNSNFVAVIRNVVSKIRSQPPQFKLRPQYEIPIEHQKQAC